MAMTRREFLRHIGLSAGTVASATMLPAHVFSQSATDPKTNEQKSSIFEAGDHRSRGIPPLEHMLKPDVYRQMAKDLKWDPVYGPDVEVNSYYGGRGDYQGHQKNPGHDPGTDYPVPLGFPLVPICESYLDVHKNYENFPGGTRVSLYVMAEFMMGYEYAHLSSRIIKLSAEEANTGKVIHKFVSPRDIIGRSGDTGRTMSPHVHVGVYYVMRWVSGNSGYWNIDFEKINKPIVPTNEGRPFFWDGRTNLYIPALKNNNSKQPRLLEQFIRIDLEEYLKSWGPSTNDSAELAGKVLEYRRLIGDKMPGKEIKESVHFHNLRSDLAKKVLVEKQYTPSDGAYAAMVSAHSYGREPKDNVMVCLPFISPHIIDKARITNWKGGLKKTQGAWENYVDDGPNPITPNTPGYTDIFYGKIRQEMGIKDHTAQK